MQLDNKCPVRHLRLRVQNDGNVRVEEVSVALYAGQPSSSASPLAVQHVGPIEAHASAEVDADVDTLNRDLTLFAIVNPDSTVEECDESNNSAQTQIKCAVVLN
jgi:CARDB